jgi:hypothetical protein
MPFTVKSAFMPFFRTERGTATIEAGPVMSINLHRFKCGFSSCGNLELRKFSNSFYLFDRKVTKNEMKQKTHYAIPPVIHLGRYSVSDPNSYGARFFAVKIRILLQIHYQDPATDLDRESFKFSRII